ncbi:NUDIX domain-containing protein [Kitasatospora sp. MBT66]|uniref:NUDIX domain-containing protein n=1 Tax=Kitasatospora sp. MBT66 TaxID=1444769 RepID=UPI0005B7D701|nr:NUDIX domain-containing protein [Kitasatospora sp. MBT66]
MSTTEATTTTPFGKIKIRTSGLVFCGTEVALLRRERPNSVHYTTVGGNVLPGEALPDALTRELKEELNLDPEHVAGAELLWLMDARLERPGPTPSPRKLHLIYRLHITPEIRAQLATEEYDELPDGGHEVGHVEWVDFRKTADLPLFPPIGAALSQLPSPDAPVTAFELAAITNDNYTWI